MAATATETQTKIALLTKEEVAKKLQLSVRTIYRMAQGGEMPAPVKIGKHVVRWRSDVLDDWMANDCARVARQ